MLVGMSGFGRPRMLLASLIGTLAVEGCGHPQPISAADVHHYTGLQLCPTAQVIDLTTPRERDTVPGFSYHIRLDLDRTCGSSLQTQLAKLWPSECPAAKLNADGCFIQDAWPKAAKHTTIVMRPLGGNRFDLAFYE